MMTLNDKLLAIAAILITLLALALAVLLPGRAEAGRAANQEGSNCMDVSAYAPSELQALIHAQPVDAFACTIVVDWGTSTRGQGRRSGGMIVGGMSSGPKGVKAYRDWFGKLPEDERKGLPQAFWHYHNKKDYAQARSAGLSPEQAMDYVHGGIESIYDD